jgi:hypothetical protein
MKKVKLILAAAIVASSVSATPAQARNIPWYFCSVFVNTNVKWSLISCNATPHLPNS